MKRDPRKNPQAGDAVVMVATNNKVKVLLRDGNSVDYRLSGREFSCTIKNWRDFVKNAEVLHTASPTEADRI